MPTIAEILTECDKETRRLYKTKIDKMYENGFLKQTKSMEKPYNGSLRTSLLFLIGC